ncbi:MAG TPA: alpha/beta fold hydrolase [Thermoanaerobaculaceae bacterium]|nr:alpha/beta fold hydrolase [Thermoanaerobaculaceae bacterium]
MSAPLAHRVDGEGEPLVLLNGGLMTVASWEPIAAVLSERFRVVRCDFRGQFLTGGAAPSSVEDHAADVAALLDALAIDAAHVIGTSFGGAVALALAALRPGRVRSLVAATITQTTDALRRDAAALHRATAEVLAGGDPGVLVDAMLPVFYSEGYLEAHGAELDARRGQFAALPRWWFAAADAILASLERFDLAPHLPRIACPTLVLAAADDSIMPLEGARTLASAIRGARLAVVGGCGHVLVVEQPDRFVSECLAFLASVEVKS